MVSWTGMVTCYAGNDFFEEALELFSEMRMVGLKPNNFTLVSVFKACLGLESMYVGRSVYACASLKMHYEMDPYVGAAILDLYTQSGDIENAQKVFEEIPKNDVVPWSLMIARYSQGNWSKEAVELFCRMRQTLVIPNQFTFASVLQASATIAALDFGKQIHCHVLKCGLDTNIFVSNALIDVYAKCGKMENSMELFVESTNGNVVTGNTIIVSHVQLGEGEKALDLFPHMLKDLVQATEVTYSSVFCACAGLAALEPSTQIHSLIIKTIYDKHIAAGNALIDMYAKCGSIKDARSVFDTMSKWDIVSWNAIISGYSMHGLGGEDLRMFEKMQKTDVKPNELTFVGVLSTCGNTGLLNKGQAYFTSMLHDHGVEPCIEHYTCMVGLLGRLGHLDWAIKLIEKMPFELVLWFGMLCLGLVLFTMMLKLEECLPYVCLRWNPRMWQPVLLSNMYATARKWDNVAFVRKNIKRKRVKKKPGLSWIENQGTVHYFTVGVAPHRDIRLIYGMLVWLNKKAKKAGYVPNCNIIFT